MALRLAEVEPHTYTYVITPTGDELPEMVEHWLRIAEMLGSPLIPVTSGKSLQGLIREYNALPNWRQRWCTRLLKIEPFNSYVMEHLPATVYVGLRADEDVREGMTFGKVEGVEQRYPLREWGWGLEEVWGYLNERGVVIPKRTDCSRCFYQRIEEWYALWKEHPDLFQSAVEDEERTGYTFRSPSLRGVTWPTALSGMREEFESGRKPRPYVKKGEQENMCRVCSL